MGRPSVIDLYERLSSAPDERPRAKVIAEAFEMLDDRYPQLQEMVTQQDLQRTERVLTNANAEIRLGIEQVRADLTTRIEEIRADLTANIEQLRTEARAMDLRLTKEIELVRAELKGDLERIRANILLWSFGFWITQLAVLLSILWRMP